MGFFDQVKSGFGLLSRAKKPQIQTRRIPDLSLWAQFQRVGGQITPTQVSEIIRMADTGYMWKLMDLANECRQKDTHLQSVLETSEQAISELEWSLVLPEDAKLKERKAAEWVEEKLRNHPQLDSVFGHQTGARFYGYAVTENEWYRDGTRLAPGEMTFHPPRRFGFEQRTGDFVWRDWNQPSVGIDFMREWPDSFIVSRPRVTGDVPVREGLVRVLMWASLFRNWTLSDWLKLGEIAWRPWRTGSYQEGAKQEDIDTLVDMLENLSTTGVGAFSDRTELKVQWPSGAGSSKPAHAELFKVIGSEMSKVVLGQTETTESSKSSGYGQAKVHRLVQQDKRNAMARWVFADVQRDLVAKMYKLNFASDIRPARISPLIEEQEDITEFAGAVEKLAKSRLRMPAAWARDRVGIPEPEKGEEVIGVDVPIDPATGLPSEPDAGDAPPPPAPEPQPEDPADTEVDETEEDPAGDGSADGST